MKNITDKSLEYSADGYSVIAPESFLQIQKEAQDMKNAIAIFAKNDLEGHGAGFKYFFIRKDPQVSLISVGVKDDKVVIAARLANSRLLQEDLNFIEKWAKIKGLQVHVAPYCLPKRV